MKKCCKCKQEKDYDGFYKDKKAKDGYNYICKLCRLEMDRNRRKKDPEWNEKRRNQHKVWRKENSEHVAAKKKAWGLTEKGRESHFKSSQKTRDKYPEKRRAHDAVYRATQKGELIRPKFCQICNKEGKIEAHHASYDMGRRTSIIWVCSKCHTEKNRISNLR